MYFLTKQRVFHVIVLNAVELALKIFSPFGYKGAAEKKHNETKDD